MTRISTTRTLALAAFLTAVTTGSAFAYTAEQEQLCTGDAMRLCSSEIPDVDRVTACMMRKQSQLSAPCRSVFRVMPEPTRAVSKPINLTPTRRGGI